MYLTRPISIALENYFSKSNTWTAPFFARKKKIQNVKWAASRQKIADWEAISVISRKQTIKRLGVDR